MTTELDKNAGFVIGTAGHIDHGKSSLVLALSGKDPDRLAEEKERGITITLGFAELDLGEGIHASVVDVPGHDRFVREMISGATGIDIALLCIAADDGIMPQTKEHLAVLELLGVPSLVVALTKCDKVEDEWADEISKDVEKFLASTIYKGSKIVKVSSKEMSGLDELRGALRELTNNSTRRIYGEIVRQPVDRSFTIKGSGTVVTGTLWSGSIRTDDTLEILPSKKRARVRSIQEHDLPQEIAYAGNRVALNLNGVSTDEVRPGCMLATPGAIEPSDVFNVELTYISTPEEKKPLKSGTEVHLSHGTKEICARVFLFNGQKKTEPGSRVFAQIRADEKLPVSWCDRFIIRSYSPVTVIGGGTILQSHPRRNTNIKDGEMKLLEALRSYDEVEISRTAFELQQYPVTPKELAKYCGLSEQSCHTAIIKLISTGKATCMGEDPCVCAAKPVINRCQNVLESALRRFHLKNPNATGISKDSLKEQAFGRMDDAVFNALLATLVDRGDIVIAGGQISHTTAGMGAKNALAEARAQVSIVLQKNYQNPPFIKEIAGKAKIDTKLCQKALNAMEADGEIVRVGKDFYFHKDAIEKLKIIVVNAIKQGSSSVADLKAAMNTSRKFAVPLLEYFDEQNITKREGDGRVLVEK